MAEASILIVDDEPEVCEVIADLLADETEWTVDYTTEPLRALEQLGQGRYDVMVTDLRMPGMDGLELARQARGLCPALGVVAVTGYASLDSSVAALRQGFVDYLQKPFQGEDIRSAVYRAIARRNPAAGDEWEADEVTYDNAVLAAANKDLQQRLDLISREMTVMQHRMAGHVADLEARAESAGMLAGQRDLAQLMGISLVLLRQCLPGEEHLVAVVADDPPRVNTVASIEGDDVVVRCAESPLKRGIIRAVMNRGQTAVIEDAEQSAVLGDLRSWMTCRGSILTLPLVGQGRVQAVAVVRREETGMAFSKTEVRRCRQQCAEVGQALETAIAFHRLEAETLLAMKSVVEAVEERCELAAGHSHRVAGLACAVARHLGIEDDRLEVLDAAAHLHDIGKVLLPAELVDRVGPLSDDAYRDLATHSERGWQMLRPIGFLDGVAELVRRHHDLAGGLEESSCEQRILAAAEAFDELTHDGPCGPALSPEEALARLQDCGCEARLLEALASVALTVD